MSIAELTVVHNLTPRVVEYRKSSLIFSPSGVVEWTVVIDLHRSVAGWTVKNVLQTCVVEVTVTRV